MTVGPGWVMSNGMKKGPPLRRGWTTGACATAAAKAAFTAILTGEFPDPVTITLPRGQTPAFVLAETNIDKSGARAGIVKDAGDDPDATDGALIVATVRLGAEGSGVQFFAGPGVGTMTKPGLPVPPGEPAINPTPRKMMRAAIEEVAETYGVRGDVEIEISIPGGEEISTKTFNARLGILGGLSILGTTGIVIPFSCSAWIHSIYQSIDVARALGLSHVVGSTGSTSEAAAQRHLGLEESALVEMGDFAGGMLKYLRRHPVPRVTIAGGVAKMTKLAQGRLDLHSKKGSVDREALARVASRAGAPAALQISITEANTTAQAFELATAEGIQLGDEIARAARDVAAEVITGAGIAIDTLLFNREGRLVSEAAAIGDHPPPPSR